MDVFLSNYQNFKSENSIGIYWSITHDNNLKDGECLYLNLNAFV